MHINAVNKYGCTPNNNPNFKKLIKDRSALNIIDKMSSSDIAEFKQIEKRLAKTKHWDLKISSIGNKFKEFCFQFIDKSNKHRVITNGVYPYAQQEKTIDIYSIIYGPENISQNTVETLLYESKERAQELYEKYMQNARFAINRGYNLSPLEALKIKEVELNILEEAIKSKNQETIITDFMTKSTTGNNLKVPVS